jgi:hypothetical protein
LEETVPLSEEELRLLEQMERALVAEDPKLASTLRGTRLRQQARRHMFVGIFVFVVGIAVLMSGAILQITPLGIAGFVVMLVSAWYTLNAWRGQNNAPQAAAAAQGQGADHNLRVIQGGKKSRSRAPKVQKRGSMMERFEERWRRRREQGPY